MAASERTKSAAYGTLTIVAILIGWEILGRTQALGSDVLPPFVDTAKALGQALGSQEFWGAVWDTLVQWGLGLVCATLVAIPAGVLIGRTGLVYRSTRSSIDFLRTIPPVMLLPLFVLVWGTGLLMVALLAVYAAVWPMLTQTITGVRQIEPATLDTARIFKIGPRRRFFRVFLPAVTPFITSGFRVSAVICLFIAIVCELVAGSPGLGQELAQAQLAGDPALMCGLILMTGVLGVLINATFKVVEARLLSWHPLYAKEN